jgi:hypothetical protein
MGDLEKNMTTQVCTSWRRAVLPALALWASACNPLPPSGADRSSAGRGEGGIEVQVEAQALSIYEVARIEVAVQPAGVSRNLVYDTDTGRFTGFLVLPPGLQHLKATAFSGPPRLEPVGVGEAAVAVLPGASAVASLVLYDSTPMPQAGNSAPVIRFVAADKTQLTPGEVVTVRSEAVDIDGDPLTYLWTDDCGGRFADPTRAVTTWVKNSTAACTLKVSASAMGAAATETLDLMVSAAADGTVTLEGRFVPRPEISSLNFCISTPSKRCYSYYDQSISRSRPRGILGVTTRDRVLVAISANLPIVEPAPDGGTTVNTTYELTDDCGGRAAVDLNNGPTYFQWTPPLVADGGIVCKLTGHARNGPLEDLMSVPVPVR